jgi:hypothetical protein
VGWTESTGHRGTLSCPWHVLARSGVFWASWARHVPGVVVLFFVLGGYKHEQVSECGLFDKVRVRGEGR